MVPKGKHIAFFSLGMMKPEVQLKRVKETFFFFLVGCHCHHSSPSYTLLFFCLFVSLHTKSFFFFIQFCKTLMRLLTQLKAEIIGQIHSSIYFLIFNCEYPVYEEEQHSSGLLILYH